MTTTGVLVDSPACMEFFRRTASPVSDLVDLWIAVAASSAGLKLLTLDSDFDRIAGIVPVELVAVS